MTGYDGSGIIPEYILERIRNASIEELIEASSLGTPEAKAARDSVPPNIARAVVHASELTPKLRDVYTDVGVSTWLRSRNRNLGGRRPLDLLLAGDFAPVDAEVERLTGDF